MGDGGFEVYAIQGRYRRLDDNGRRRRLSHWLVDFVNTVPSRATFSQLTNSSFRVLKRRFDGKTHLSDFLRFTEEADFDLDGAVLYTGDQEMPATTFYRVASQVRSYCSGSVLTVGKHEWRTSSVRLHGASITPPAAAVAALSFMPGIGALPGQPKRFHFGDAFEQFGPSRRNAVLVEALWFLGEDRLVYADFGSAEAVRGASLIVAVVVGDAKNVQEQMAVRGRELKRAAPAESIIWVREPSDRFLPAYRPANVAAVTMLAYPDSVDARLGK